MRIALCIVFFLGACSEKKPTQKQGQVNTTTPSGQGPHAIAPHGKANPHAAGANPHAGGANPHAGGAWSGGGQAPHGNMGGGVDVTQLGLQAPDPNRKIDASKSLAGTIDATKEIKAKFAAGDVLFVSVKRKDPATGKPFGGPLATDRLVFQNWPIPFRLTEANAMIAGTDFSGDVVITVWKDLDQDAISKHPDEPIVEFPATIPNASIKMTMSRLRGN